MNQKMSMLGKKVYVLIEGKINYRRIRKIDYPSEELPMDGIVKVNGNVMYSFGKDMVTNDDYLLKDNMLKVISIEKGLCFDTKEELIKSLE